MKIQRILLIEDHPIFRKGLVQLLETEPRLKVTGEAEGKETVWPALEKREYDLILLDLTLKDTSGLELLKDIHYRYPLRPILVVSMHEEEYYAERVINAGARGYIMKQEAADQILGAVRKVLNGGIYLSENMKSRLGTELPAPGSPSREDRISRLSDRELEILQLTGQGLGTSGIARQSQISVKTVETYKEHLKEKLALSSSAELRRFAIEWMKKP